MKIRRRSLITREGFYYLFILGFVIVGSLLRHINLLVGLSAILTTAMLFNWRMTRAGLRQIQFGRRVQPPVWCNRPTTFEVEVRNPRKYLSSFSIMVSQRFRPKQVRSVAEPHLNWIQKLVRYLRGNTVNNYVLLDAVHVGQTKVAQQILEFRDRGEYEMGPLTISTHFPLGLTRREITDNQRLPLLVGPALGTLTYGWVDRMLGLGWQDASGGSTSRSGEEFFSLRPWMNGDSRRWVHWRATARHGTVLVRQFQRSQSKAFSLVVDLCLAEDEKNSETQEEVEKLLRIVATISNSVRDGHADTAKITIVADQVHRISFPCNEEKWQQWHRDLATIVATTDTQMFLNQLIETPTIMDIGSADSSPVVVLSRRNMDEFSRQIRNFNLTTETEQGESNSTAIHLGEQFTSSNSVAVKTQSKARSIDSKQATLWAIQRQIRTWLTPGDARLSSWYIDAPAWKDDPTDVNTEETV